MSKNCSSLIDMLPSTTLVTVPVPRIFIWLLPLVSVVPVTGFDAAAGCFAEVELFCFVCPVGEAGGEPFAGCDELVETFGAALFPAFLPVSCGAASIYKTVA